MAPQSSSNCPDKVPLPQFLVALLLVKSKPYTLSIQGLHIRGNVLLKAYSNFCVEYLASLRSYIRSGARPKLADTPHSYVDATAFWRQAYTKSEEAQIILRARLVELELRDNENVEEGALPNAANSQRKRKRTPVVASQPSSTKKLKKAQVLAGTNASEPRKDEPIRPAEDLTPFRGDSIEQSMSTIATPEMVCSSFCLYTYSIRRLIRAASESKTLMPSQFVMANGIETSARRQEFQRQFDSQKALMTKLLAISPTFSRILQAADMLGENGTEKSLQQVAIYSIVQVLHALIRAICDTARTQAKVASIENTDSHSHTRSRSKRATKVSIKNVLINKDTARELCHILLSVLDHLKPTNSVHREILDGFLFHFLTAIGERLKHAVFSEPISQEISDEESTQDKAEDEVTRAQGPYLLLLLERINKIAADFAPQSETVVEALGVEDPAASRTLPSSDLTSLARTKLQHTLLNAVFGKEGADDFEPALHPPTLPQDLGSVLQLDPTADGMDEKERFKDGVWRLLGWDVLREYTAWSGS
ncbi:MAG: hypothetical protein Q9217_004997 [Psora testacea]